MSGTPGPPGTPLVPDLPEIHDLAARLTAAVDELGGWVQQRHALLLHLDLLARAHPAAEAVGAVAHQARAIVEQTQAMVHQLQALREQLEATEAAAAGPTHQRQPQEPRPAAARVRGRKPRGAAAPPAAGRRIASRGAPPIRR